MKVSGRYADTGGDGRSWSNLHAEQLLTLCGQPLTG